MTENITAGLASGFFVSIFVLAFNRFWNAVIIPWFEERVYKDAHIEGKWFSLYTAGMGFRQEVISLKRHGHSVNGKVICIHGPDEGEEYSVKGSFRNLILPLVYENTNKASADRGTITLKSNRAGKLFSGKVALYSDPNDRIEESNVTWFREKDDLEKTLDKLKLSEKEVAKLLEKGEEIRTSIEEIEKSTSEVEKGVVETEGDKIVEDEEKLSNVSLENKSS